MPRFISKSTGARTAKPNGLALIKKKPSISSSGRRSTLDKRIIRRIESKCGCLQNNLSELIWKRFGNDINNEEFGDKTFNSVSLNSDGTIIAVGSKKNDGDTVNSDRGHVQVYTYDSASTQWVQLGQDIDGENTGDKSGHSVSLSSDGTILAIGSINNDDGGNNSGHVRVYNYNSTNKQWVQLGQDIDGENTGDNSSYSVSLSSDGTILAIGAINNDDGGNNSGHVRVYSYNSANNNWTKLGQDIAGAAADKFGWSVSLSSDGTVLAVGAKQVNTQDKKGYVQIYEWINTAWVQLGQDIDGESNGDRSGHSISLSKDGNVVIIGSPANQALGVETGHARVFKWNNTTWEQQGNHIVGTKEKDKFGFSVSINNDGTIIGISGTQSDVHAGGTGYIQLYKWNGNSWEQYGQTIYGKLDGPIGAEGRSGQSISLSNDGLVLATTFLSGGLPGGARIFKLYSE